MDKMINLFPELVNSNMKELNMVKHFTKDLDDEQLKTFAHVYRAQRKDPQTTLLLCLVGFLGLFGLQRFYLNDIGLGILYFFTAGICFIGQIVDIVRYQELTVEHNTTVAQNILILVKNGNGTANF